jgi:hypothetical protein
MREPRTIFLILVVSSCIFPAGCVQSPGSSPVTPAVPATTVPMPEPATPVPTAAVTSTPQEVVTVIRYVSPLKDVKDSGLLFTLQVPAEWNVSTYQMTNSDTSDYRTDLVADNVFTVYTYPVTRSREQAYRDQFRLGFPAPVETTVIINGIRYDRFERRVDGNTTVVYIANTNSANERGYASVLVFTARDCNRFEREDFEKVVSSFRYFSGRSSGTTPGEEIPLYDLSGNAVSRNAGGGHSLVFNSSEWDSAEGFSFGGGSSDKESSERTSTGEGSSDGGHCGH